MRGIFFEILVDFGVYEQCEISLGLVVSSYLVSVSPMIPLYQPTAGCLAETIPVAFPFCFRIVDRILYDHPR